MSSARGKIFAESLCIIGSSCRLLLTVMRNTERHAGPMHRKPSLEFPSLYCNTVQCTVQYSMVQTVLPAVVPTPRAADLD